MDDTLAVLPRVWAHISKERLLDSTYRLVAIPSPTGSEAAVAQAYADLLGQSGLRVEIDAEEPASPSVIGRWSGPAGRPVLQFDGHTDTIDVPHARPVLDRVQGVVHGRGAADMKGGLAAVAEALRALAAADVRLNGGILVTAHGLHEAPLGDQRTLRSLIRRGITGNAAIVAELGESFLPIAAKGSAIFRLTATRAGTPIHEAEASPATPHPLRAVTHLLAALEERQSALRAHPLPLLGPETVFVGEVHGGDFYNRVPVSAQIVGTRRYAAPHTMADLSAEFADLCQQAQQATGATVRYELQNVGAPFQLSPDDPLVWCVRTAYALATGQELPVRGINVVGNAADLVGLAGITAVYHGVNQTTAHADHEYVSARDLERAARVYAAAVLLYLNNDHERRE